MKQIVDVLIVGSGVSGLYCALNLDEKLNVVVVSKSSLKTTNTYLAQGGISTARGYNDIELFIEDTLKAGQYKNKIESVNVLAQESIENIEQMIGLGVNFDRINGDILYTKEGAHSINRIVHTKDNTGESVEKTLIDRVRERKNITVYEDTFLVDIISKNNICTGAILIKDNKQVNIYAKSVVLATGGIGGLFNNSTNQEILNGDGIAIALKNKIKLKDINYIQIHPTAFYEGDKPGKRLLISEAVRGEGAKLLDINGERFVDELLPRDVVSKSILNKMKSDKSSYVYLDVTFMEDEFIKHRFPLIYEECLKRGTDITKEYIKVSPAQHYFMGGIDVDLNSKTSMNNLYAVGETSCTGVHGANRLASNSLLEGLVFSRRCANNINDNIQNISILTTEVENINKNIDEIIVENKKIVINEIKKECGDKYDELLSCR